MPPCGRRCPPSCVAVYVKGEGDGSVAQIALYGFHVVAVLQGKDGKGVPEIMYPAVWCSDLNGQLFVMVVDGLWAQIPAGGRGEYQGNFPLLCITPAGPQHPSFEFLCGLFSLSTLQQREDRGSFSK